MNFFTKVWGGFRIQARSICWFVERGHYFSHQPKLLSLLSLRPVDSSAEDSATISIDALFEGIVRMRVLLEMLLCWKSGCFALCDYLEVRAFEESENRFFNLIAKWKNESKTEDEARYSGDSDQI